MCVCVCAYSAAGVSPACPLGDKTYVKNIYRISSSVYI